MRIAPVLFMALAACDDATMRFDRATPDYGPLAGGTRITLEGEHFAVGARVFVGDREAPLAAVSRDGTTIEVVIPPGEAAGPAKLVIIGDDDVAGASDAFRYTTEPTLEAVSVAKVIPGTSTVATLTGTGFMDEGAGYSTLLVDGVPVTAIGVQNDTTLTFVVPDGLMLVQPTLQLLNDRGSASLERAFRYVPTLNPSLVLFPTYSGELAEVFDLVDHKLYSIPRPTSLIYRFSSVYVDGRGEYWALDRARKFGRLDMRTGQLVDPVTLTTELPAMTPYAGAVLGIDRYTIRSLDPSTGVLSQSFTAPLGCCGGFGIAADDHTLYVTSRATGLPILRTFDPEADAFSDPTALQGASTFMPEELRVVDHVLYTTSRDGTLCTIDPATGAVTVLAAIPRTNAFDVLR